MLNYLRIHKKDFVLEIGDQFKVVGENLYYCPKGDHNKSLCSSINDLWRRTSRIQVPKKYEQTITRASNIKKMEDEVLEVVDVDFNFQIPKHGGSLFFVGIKDDGSFDFREVEIKSNTKKQIVTTESFVHRQRYLKSDLDIILSRVRFGSDMLPYNCRYGVFFTDFEKFDDYRDKLVARLVQVEVSHFIKSLEKIEKLKENIESQGFIADDELQKLASLQSIALNHTLKEINELSKR